MGRNGNFGKVRGCRSPRYRVCTKAMFRSNTMPWIDANFQFRSYTAVYEIGYFSGPWRFVHFMHQDKSYIIGLSFHLASFWYNYYLSVNMVPWRWDALNWRKFPLAALYGDIWNRLLCGPVEVCTLLYPNKNYIFGLSSPLAPFWYNYCLSTNMVPWR